MSQAKKSRRFRWWYIPASVGILFVCILSAAIYTSTTPGYKARRTAQAEQTQQAGRPVVVAVYTRTPIPPTVTNTRKPRSTKTPTIAPTVQPTIPATPKATIAATAAPTAEPTQPPAPTAAPTNPPVPTQPPAPTAIPPTAMPATEAPPPPTAIPPTEAPPPPTAVPPTEAPPPPTDIPPPPPAGNVVIAGVFNDGTVEHVTITNQGGSDADLSGWSVTGSKGDDRYTFPSGYVLPAEQSVRLHSGDGGTNNPPYDIYWTTKSVWNNSGETVFLWDAQGNKVHELSY